VILPRLNLRADLSFLVDTGADGVFIMPGDALRMGIDYGSLELAPGVSVGVGGETRDFLEPAVLAFTDGDQVYVYDMAVTIGHVDANLLAVPSLLGREVLDRWHLVYRPARGILQATPDSVDVTIPIPPGFGGISPVEQRR
jgi:hypothetical protein